MHNIDEMLGDIGLDIGRARRLREWLMPLDPGAYASITPTLVARR